MKNIPKMVYYITPETKNNKTPWKIQDIIIAYVFIIAFTFILAGIMVTIKVDADNMIFPVLVQILISLFTISVVYFIISKKYNLSFLKTIGFSSGKIPSHVATGFFVSFVIVFFTSLISYTFTEVGGIQRENPYVNLPKEKMQFLSFAAIFMAPVVEEIFFRGFMQPAMVKYVGVFGGVLLTAFIFGISHVQYLDYSTALVSVISIGLILGVTKETTGSIVPCVLAHFLNNLYASLNFM